MKCTFNLLLFIVTTIVTGYAQQTIVMGRVIDSDAIIPVSGATILIEESTISTSTDIKGIFKISDTNLPLGEQVMVVSKVGYNDKRIRIVIEEKSTINLDPILFEIDISAAEAQIGIISLSDQELQEDEGTVFAISGLLQSSKDVFLNAAAFDFSATFFRPRGLDNSNGEVLINGIIMNRQFSGRPQWATWGGLNDVQRNREFSMGLQPSAVTFGDLAGSTNLVMRASQYRKGGRISYAIANRSYEGRVMGSYHTGLLKNGWAFSVLASRRFGVSGYVEGTSYDANSFFVSAEKKLNQAHSINFTAFYTPNRRGRASAITQEVADLKGTRYNPNWGFQNETVRNSSIREIKVPIAMINYNGLVSKATTLNINIGYQFGSVGTTRIDAGGTRLLSVKDQEVYLGGARNPFGNYYQRLPSFFLQDENPSPTDYQNAYVSQQEFINNGQLSWDELYQANSISSALGGNAIYVLQEDRTDHKKVSFNTILESQISENILLNTGIRYNVLTSENFALLKDMLGGSGYLDVDFFAEGEDNSILANVAQSDLKNRNRIVQEGERYKYNYELTSTVFSGFAQAQFKSKFIDYYLAVTMGQTGYQRNGLYENGNYPGSLSFGESEALSFTNFGIKGGATYKVSGRHLVDVHAGYFTKAPTLRNSFSNVRQSNQFTNVLEPVLSQYAEMSYRYRSPIVKARITGFFLQKQNETDIGFYFTENLTGLGSSQSAFVQEVLTGIETANFGGELGVEAKLTATFTLKAAAAFGQYLYTNNPNLYLTSDDFDGALTFGDGAAQLQNYHLATGPERAYQLGFEYRDPEFWWVGASTNYFSNAYIDVNKLARTANFSQDFDGQIFNDYNEDVAKQLLTQEQFPPYFLVNVVGGKSWRVKSNYIGFFATVNNLLNQEYKTGGFEQGRLANYKDLKEDFSKTNGRIFGPRYFFGNGTTYYLNVYARF